MPTAPAGARYLIRRKVLVLTGASFHIYDDKGSLVGFCRQKAFRLREDLRVYTDESRSKELFSMRARSILDFGVTFSVTLPDGSSLGSLRRKGLKSMFRDSWLIFGPGGEQLATITEDSAWKATMRRLNEFVATLMPQSYHVVRADGAHLAAFQGHLAFFTFKLSVSILQEDPLVDDLLLLAAACLLAAVEGRQG